LKYTQIRIINIYFYDSILFGQYPKSEQATSTADDLRSTQLISEEVDNSFCSVTLTNMTFINGLIGYKTYIINVAGSTGIKISKISILNSTIGETYMFTANAVEMREVILLNNTFISPYFGLLLNPQSNIYLGMLKLYETAILVD